MLLVNNKTTTVPSTGAPTTVQVVSVCYRGDMSALRENTLKILEQDRRYLIGMDEIQREAREAGVDKVVAADDEEDFIAEFVPEQIVTPTPTPESPQAPTPEPVQDEAPPPAPAPPPLTPRKRRKKDESESNDEVQPPPSISDPVLAMGHLKAVAETGKQIDLVQSMRKLFPGRAVNGTLPMLDLLRLADKWLNPVEAAAVTFIVPLVPPEVPTPAPTPPAPEPTPRATPTGFGAWDKGPAATRDQKFEIVHLKKALEAEGKCTPEVWVNTVALFSGADGKALTSAADMTEKQAKIFIQRLNTLINGDEVPF